MPKGLKVMAITLFMIGFLGQWWGLTIWNRYWDVLPRSPDVTNGRIYPFGMRGVTVYESLQERRKLSFIEGLSLGLCCTGFALGLACEWKKGTLKRFFGW